MPKKPYKFTEDTPITANEPAVAYDYKVAEGKLRLPKNGIPMFRSTARKRNFWSVFARLNKGILCLGKSTKKSENNGKKSFWQAG